MARAQTAPVPAQLIHLRPDDRAGARVVALALVGTAAAIALSTLDGWLLWLAGQGLLALMFVRWFVILHECGHETLFRTRRYHAVAGRLAAFFSLIPFHAWTRVHGRHHKWTGWQDLDPTTAALVPRPLGRAERTLVNVCWRLWIPIFSVLYRVTNYWHLPRLVRMFPKPADRASLLRDGALLLALYALIIYAAGFAAMLRTTGLALVVSLALEDLLLLSQHTHLPQHISHGADVRPFPAVEQEPFTRSLRLPAAASAFVLHFDAHELHHMYPFVPGYHLRRIDYAPGNEIGWWPWLRAAKSMPGDILLFQPARIGVRPVTRVDPQAAALFLLAAFTLAGVAQTAWFRSPISRAFAVPLDGGLRIRGRRLFGPHKTLRGFVIMLPAAAAAFALLSFSAADAANAWLWRIPPAGYALLGAWAGCGFMAGELPNSLLKRQLDIAPGSIPQRPLAAALHFLLDRFDSGVGMLAALSLAVEVPWLTWVYVLLIGPFIHWAFSVVMFRLGLKGRPA